MCECEEVRLSRALEDEAPAVLAVAVALGLMETWGAVGGGVMVGCLARGPSRVVRLSLLERPVEEVRGCWMEWEKVGKKGRSGFEGGTWSRETGRSRMVASPNIF